MALISCPNCGASISDRAEYCPKCGAKIEPEKDTVEGIKCEECGSMIPAGSDVCPDCGCPVTPAPGSETPPAVRAPEPAEKKTNSKKIIIIAVALLALIAVGIAIHSQNNSGKSNTETGSDDYIREHSDWKYFSEFPVLVKPDSMFYGMTAIEKPEVNGYAYTCDFNDHDTQKCWVTYYLIYLEYAKNDTDGSFRMYDLEEYAKTHWIDIEPDPDSERYLLEDSKHFAIMGYSYDNKCILFTFMDKY